uniref:ATP synthase complex subunit 8 n=1 Tax=Bittacomorphella fenderiana TaxID=1111053 RepID=G8J8B5_9DIPT|nr:ATP synthase F0 subunit 8 [Bittacomorphella fenderiana]
MPQMAPMSWLILFMFFSIIFIMFNMMNYYNSMPIYSSKTKSITNIKINSMNWKW